MTLTTYHIRDILDIPIANIWDIPKGVYLLQMEDGIGVHMYHSHIQFNRLVLEICRNFPDAPIKSNHVFNGSDYGPSTHLDLLSAITWDAFDFYMERGSYLDMGMVSLRCYEITNLIYNVLTYKLEEYVNSSCILDYIDIYTHPDISKHVEAVRHDPYPTSAKIEQCTSLVAKTITSGDFMPDNPIVRVVRSKNTKVESIIQSIAMRGVAAEIDNQLFRKPILNGYLFGVDKLVDQMMDSRTSAKALSYAKKPMQDSEYLNRKIQLLAANVQRIHYHDCGTKRYFDVYINTEKMFIDYIGKWFVDPLTGVERELRKSDMANVVGTTIKIRRVFSCLVNDRQGVCIKCFGSIGYSIPVGTNIGHQCAISLQSPIGQLLLSAKHFTANGSADLFTFNDVEKRFVETRPGLDNVFFINNRLAKYRYKIKFFTKEAEGLSSLKTAKAFKGLIATRYSELSVAMFIVSDDEGNVIDVFNVNLQTPSGSRKSSFSVEALEYIIKTGWENFDDGTFEVDMCNWDVNNPFLIMPMKQFSTVDFMKSVEKFIRGEPGMAKPMIKCESIEEAVNEFHELISDRLSINIAVLETVMLACMKESENDLRLPLDKMNGQFARYTDLMFGRSLSAWLAFQTQVKAIVSPQTYIYTRRPVHYLDKFLTKSRYK